VSNQVGCLKAWRSLLLIQKLPAVQLGNMYRIVLCNKLITPSQVKDDYAQSPEEHKVSHGVFTRTTPQAAFAYAYQAGQSFKLPFHVHVKPPRDLLVSTGS
jgi:hypothetical protein